MSFHPTKGPWRWLNDRTLVGDHGERPVILIATSHNKTPYLAERCDDGMLERLNPKGPNARLIAAAPEMLDCLKRLQALLKKENIKLDFYSEKSIDQVIAKAQGDPHEV